MARCIGAAMLVGALALALPAAAQDFPTRPIRLIVPFTPGTTDTLARAIAQRAQLGQPIVVENVPGATGAIGYQRAARAPADGYTLTIGSTGTFAVSPNYNPKIGFDPIGEFAPIAMYARLPIVLVMPPSLPVKTIPDLVAYARANPGKLNYASVSPGTTSHILGEMLKQATGMQIEHIPYKGGTPALVALLGGEVQLLFASLLEAMQHIQAGKIRALGVADARRATALPDVPTLAELGLNLDTPIWYGLFAPARTPAPVVQKLAAEVLRIAAQDDFKQFLAAQGAEPANLAPEAFRELVAREHAKYGKVIRDANLRASD